MDANVWRRVEGLYYRIAAEPSENRAALLDEACHGEPDLRREVEALLEARDKAASNPAPWSTRRCFACLTATLWTSLGASGTVAGVWS